MSVINNNFSLIPENEFRDHLFIINSMDILVKTENNDLVLPGTKDFGEWIIKLDRTEYLGMTGNVRCFCLSLGDDIQIPADMSFKNLREIMGLFDPELCSAAQRAVHIANWINKSRYCGVCGAATERSEIERARVCKSCGNVIYPRISPAVIISIIKDGKILLAHNKRFPGGYYGLIAGFIEPGETFEDAAKREALEEVGITITDIRYLESQPWPFPDSLMIGLTAEYSGGEISPDGEEIDNAGWFGPDELPNIPGSVSIAGRLIERFAREYKNKK